MPSVTFFGATGGCTLAALTRSLEAEVSSVALVRSAQKLQDLLTKHDVSPTKIASHLTIIEGDVKDVASVRKALVQSADSTKHNDIVICGVGSVPKSGGWNLRQPITLQDPHICEDATKVILEALQKNHDAGVVGDPQIAVISTTGLSTQRDVPLAFLPLYHWLLAVPHEDKRAMESLVEEGGLPGQASQIKSFVIVRASLLTDGEGKGVSAIRIGWEGGESTGHGPAIGYTITRDDVGAWLFEALISGEAREEWAGRKVTLTS